MAGLDVQPQAGNLTALDRSKLNPIDLLRELVTHLALYRFEC